MIMKANNIHQQPKNGKTQLSATVHVALELRFPTLSLN